VCVCGCGRVCGLLWGNVESVLAARCDCPTAGYCQLAYRRSGWGKCPPHSGNAGTGRSHADVAPLESNGATQITSPNQRTPSLPSPWQSKPALSQARPDIQIEASMPPGLHASAQTQSYRPITAKNAPYKDQRPNPYKAVTRSDRAPDPDRRQCLPAPPARRRRARAPAKSRSRVAPPH